MAHFTHFQAEDVDDEMLMTRLFFYFQYKF